MGDLAGLDVVLLGWGANFCPSLGAQEISYGSGLLIGEQFIDTVTLGNLVITKQGVGSATLAIGFEDVDGILGSVGSLVLMIFPLDSSFPRSIGPGDLTIGTTSGGEQIPTVTENAFSQGLIPQNLIGISFEPTTSPNQVNGELTFGGIDSSKFTGTLDFVCVSSRRRLTWRNMFLVR